MSGCQREVVVYRIKIWVFLMTVAVFSCVFAETNSPNLTAGEVLYRQDFEKVAAGSVPEDFLVLNGTFSVREEGGGKFLELPGTPLETFGLLFGPTETDAVSVSARIFFEARSRAFSGWASPLTLIVMIDCLNSGWGWS